MSLATINFIKWAAAVVAIVLLGAVGAKHTDVTLEQAILAGGMTAATVAVTCWAIERQRRLDG